MSGGGLGGVMLGGGGGGGTLSRSIAVPVEEEFTVSSITLSKLESPDEFKSDVSSAFLFILCMNEFLEVFTPAF